MSNNVMSNNDVSEGRTERIKIMKRIKELRGAFDESNDAKCEEILGEILNFLKNKQDGCFSSIINDTGLFFNLISSESDTVRTLTCKIMKKIIKQNLTIDISFHSAIEIAEKSFASEMNCENSRIIIDVITLLIRKVDRLNEEDTNKLVSIIRAAGDVPIDRLLPFMSRTQKHKQEVYGLCIKAFASEKYKDKSNILESILNLCSDDDLIGEDDAKKVSSLMLSHCLDEKYIQRILEFVVDYSTGKIATAIRKSLFNDEQFLSAFTRQYDSLDTAMIQMIIYLARENNCLHDTVKILNVIRTAALERKSYDIVEMVDDLFEEHGLKS
jgi:hypothetical protein